MRTFVPFSAVPGKPASLFASRFGPSSRAARGAPESGGSYDGRAGYAFGRVAVHGRAPTLPQAKLAIGAPGDAYEREADRAADQVMRMPVTGAAPPQVQRCAACAAAAARQEEDGPAARQRLAKGDLDERMASLAGPAPEGENAAEPPKREPEDEEPAAAGRRVQRKESSAAAGGGGQAVAPPAVHQVLASGGSPLAAGTRSFMEQRFGHDFSRVRIHTDHAASRSAESMQALAYTVGHDVVFRSGRYDTGSQAGQHLLAHELAHVIQQSAAAPLVQRAPAPAAGRLAASRVPLGVQRAIATSVAPDGVASNALGACDWGLTFPESVDETVSAVKSGATWKADPTALKGHYSQQTRLLPSEKEVTGPAGNTTSANFCAQVGELSRLGDCGGAWYMKAAVVAHENVHAAHFNPALTAASATIQADFNGVTVPDAPGKAAGTALTELQALPGYATAKGKMQNRWLTQVLALAAGDHGGPAAAAEHTVVDPMVNTICAHAKAAAWPACASCPP